VVYLRFFLLAIAPAFVLGISGIEAQQAFADVIDFESDFVDLQPVGVVVTPTNTVTFGVDRNAVISCTNPTSAFIAKVGLPLTAYFPNDDIPAGASGGSFFLTDEKLGNLDVKLDYCISFATPVNNLSLDLYDYRFDGGPSVGDSATLTVFDAGGSAVGSAIFVITSIELDPNLATLSIQSPTGLISSAHLLFNRADVGTGIDNITFTTNGGENGNGDEECEEGFFFNGEVCVPIVCDEGEVLIGNECVPIVCDEGEVLIGNECVLCTNCM